MQLEDIKKQQQLASNPKFSSWVFASAGSGKTRILVNRILRLLLNDVSPEKILCLTFTKAGASEMEERINNDLIKWANLDDDSLAKNIREIQGISATSQSINKAKSLIFKMFEGDLSIKIQTIHSFCQTLLKIFSFEANLSPNFEVLEENSQNILIKNSIESLFKKARTDKDLQQLISSIFAIKNYNEIYSIISNIISNRDKLFNSINFYGSIANLTNELYRKCDININDNKEKIVEKFKKDNGKDNISNLILFFTKSKIKSEKNILKNINAFYNNEIDFEQYYSTFFTSLNKLRKPSKNLSSNPNILEELKQYCKNIQEYLDKIYSVEICHESKIIIYFGYLVINSYDELKNNSNLLDYDDLINKTNELLKNSNFGSWVQMKMDSSYEHILIDESQDTNIKQWQIINLLCDDFFSGVNASKNNRSIFVVGDEKQSIYSFQGAQSDISNKIYQYYHNNNSKIVKIELNNSFRSAVNILKNVDAVFSQNKYAKSLISSNYYQQHNPIRNIIGKFEIWPQIKNDRNYDDKKFDWTNAQNEETSAKELMAINIAKKIKYEVLTMKKLENCSRSVNYSDYMILLRNKINGFDQEIIKAFSKYNIPYSSQSRVNFSDSLIIQDFLSIAKFTININDNLNLAALLKSPIFNLNDRDLVNIISFNKEQNIITNISKIKKYYNYYQKLITIKNNAFNLNLQDFYYDILFHSNHEELFCHYYGSQFLEVRDKFYNIVNNYAQNNYNNLQKFIEFIDQCNPQINLKSHDDNSVRIITIHSSKGLQAPIVIIADCSFNSCKLKSSKENISWIENDDIENLYIPLWISDSKKYNNLANSHKKNSQIKAFDEYLRLLYVAMTRAEDELYIAAFGNDNDENSWYEIIKNSVNKSLYNSNIYDEINSNYNKISDKITSENQIFDDINFKKNSKICNISPDNENVINFATIKGEIIHKIIDFINQNYHNNHDWLRIQSNNILQKYLILQEEDKKNIINNINQYLSSNFFKDIKNYTIKSEVEVIHNNKLKRIDLIIFKNNTIEIIDFKSDQEILNKISLKYKNQLAIYKESIKNLYPNHLIECYIVWLCHPKTLKMKI